MSRKTRKRLVFNAMMKEVYETTSVALHNEYSMRLFKKSSFDHEGYQEAYSTSNIEFGRSFGC